MAIYSGKIYTDKTQIDVENITAKDEVMAAEIISEFGRNIARQDGNHSYIIEILNETGKKKLYSHEEFC